MSFLAAAALIASGRPQSSCAIRLTSMQTVDAAGQPTTYQMGEEQYRIKASFHVDGQPKQGYKIRFALFGRSFEFPVKANPGDYIYTASMNAPTDEDLIWRVDIDPEAVSGNGSPEAASGKITAKLALPATAIERFGSVRRNGEQSFTVNWRPGTVILHLEETAGAPVSSVISREVTYTPVPGGTRTLDAQGMPVTRMTLNDASPDVTTVGFKATVEVSNFRSNPDLLNAVTWSQLNQMPPALRRFLLQRDGKRPSEIAGLKEFVEASVSAEDRVSLSPYRLARKLFLAVAKKLSYTLPNPGDTAEVLRQCKGDCGGFSGLFAAACRYVGIPVREIAGCRVPDLTHVWTELWLPDYGWIPQDCTDSNSIDPKGITAYCFGVLPDGNKRFSCSMQTGMFYWQGTGPGHQSTAFKIHLE